MDNALVVFQDKKIRRIWHDNEWYFSVVDVVAVLTDSTDAKDYWYRLKKREQEEGINELSTICRQLKLPSADGKYNFINEGWGQIATLLLIDTKGGKQNLYK